MRPINRFQHKLRIFRKNKNNISKFILNNKNQNIEAELIEFAFLVSIQSDGNYTLKIGPNKGQEFLYRTP